MEQIQLKIRVEQVLFPRTAEQADWYVLATDQGKMSGNMAWRPEPGQRLIVEGAWGAYLGARTFKFRSAMCDVPTDPHAKLAYVIEKCSGAGHSLLSAIWEKWRDDWEKNYRPDVIPRFGGRLFENFQGALSDVNTEGMKSEAMAWLMAKGATMGCAAAAWEEWEDETVGVVSANCYRLADLPHFGFSNVDRSVRVHFGIEDGDPRRIQAGVLYALRQLTDSGSTAIEWNDLFQASVKLLGGIYSEKIVEAVKAMFDDGSLRGFSKSHTIALGQDFWNETEIWNYVNGRENNTPSPIAEASQAA